MRGNVVEMAVGVIIGGAFVKIVTSVINDIIMPSIGVLMGRVDFKSLKLVIQQAQIDATTREIIKRSCCHQLWNFINITLDFLIIAFAIFLIIKAINSFKK